MGIGKITQGKCVELKDKWKQTEILETLIPKRWIEKELPVKETEK